MIKNEIYGVLELFYFILHMGKIRLIMVEIAYKKIFYKEIN